MSKIDDIVPGDADTTKLMDLGLVYGDIISYRQMFPSTSTSKVASYKERAQELKMKIQRTHSGRTDAMKQPIHINKVYNVVIGIRCYDKNEYKLKLNRSFTKPFNRNATYREIHAVAVGHFETGQVPTFLGSYEGHKIERNFETLEHYALKRKDKKQAVKLYLYYPKSYQKLEWHKICSNLPLDDTSDEELPSFIHTVTAVNKNENTKVLDSIVDFDMQVRPTENFLHEISGQEIHHDNTIGESITDNSLSAIVNDCPSNDFNIDNVSEICGQQSFDIRSICPKCTCTYIGESCLRCQQNAEYDASLANDVSKTGELLHKSFKKL